MFEGIIWWCGLAEGELRRWLASGIDSLGPLPVCSPLGVCG